MVPLMNENCENEKNRCLYMTPHIHGVACDDECVVCHGEEEFKVYVENGDVKRQVGTAVRVDEHTVSIQVTDPQLIHEVTGGRPYGISYGRYGPYADEGHIQTIDQGENE
jgi:hypothetical protein